MLLVDRYGEAIEYDLHTRAGLDLLDFFRGIYSWRKLCAILDRLPSGSAYWAARLDDDEAADEMDKARKAADKGKGSVSDKPAPPSLAEMDLRTQLAMSTNDLLLVVVDRLERLAGHTGEGPKPSPRPTTAMGRIKERAERAQITDLVAEAHAAQARAAKLSI